MPRPRPPRARKWASLIRNTESLRAFFARSYVPRRLIGASITTRWQYEIQFRHFERFLNREPTLDDLDDEIVGGFLAWLSAGEDRDFVPRAAPTVNKARSHICALWNLAAKKKLVAEFPDIAPLPEPEPVPIAWRTDEVRKLLIAAAAQPGKIAGIPARYWWDSIIRAWLDTGERTWALLSAEPGWLDREAMTLRVFAHVRKGRKKAMFYHLRSSTIRSIDRIYDVARDRIWPWPQHRTSLYNHFARLLKRAGLPGGRRRKGQALRITFASHLELHGGDATKALRHSDRKVTERSYLDRTLLDTESPIDRLPDWDGAA